MDISVCLFYVGILQVVSGEVFPFIGHYAINSGQIIEPLPNINARRTRGVANGVPTANQIARNVATNGNSLTNFGNANTASANLASANFAGQHFANNMAGNSETSNANLGYAVSNFDNLANSNFIHGNLARPDATQMYQSNFANPTHANIAGYTDNFNAASPYPPNIISNNANLNFANDIGISNPASNLAGNLASGHGNYANGNIAGAISNLASGLNLNEATFRIGDNPFQVIGGSPGNHQLGLHVVADALEVAGTVSVAGKMPIYGTVSLNGNLPTEGKASVNYGCTSQPIV